jgi:hypothetical protein
VRWNGPLNDFTILAEANNNYQGIKAGDVLLGTNVNGLITVYVNGVVVAQAADNTYTGGSPGLGFWLSEGDPSLNTTFGFSFFTATDGGLPTPMPTPDPSATPTPTPTATPSPTPTPHHHYHWWN